jgi:hypothetical protein
MLTFGHRDEHLEGVLMRTLRRHEAQKVCRHESARRGDSYCSRCGKQLRSTTAQVRELEGQVRRILLDEYDLPVKNSRVTRRDRRFPQATACQLLRLSRFAVRPWAPGADFSRRNFANVRRIVLALDPVLSLSRATASRFSKRSLVTSCTNCSKSCCLC